GRLQALQPIFAKADLASLMGRTGHASPHLFPVLNFFRHQHSVNSFPISNCQMPIPKHLPACSSNRQLAIGNRQSAMLPVSSWAPAIATLATFATFALATRTRAALALFGARIVNRIGAGAPGHGCFRIQNGAAINPTL